MKTISVFLLLLLFTACNTQNTTEEQPSESTSDKEDIFKPYPKQFSAIWDKIKSDPVDELPQLSVSYSKLFSKGIDLISRDANRTLSSHDDILAPFEKLAHPNGVCMSGVWSIEKSNPYSGYFKQGSQGLVIARASSAMSNTKKGETRAFGLAIKLFATMDKNETLTNNSANFFTIDDLGGTDAEYFMDVALTNEPDVSFTGSVFSSFAYGLKVASAFSNADENSGIRQVYEISYLDENSSNIVTPKWIQLKARSGQIKSNITDFREEFSIQNTQIIIYDISVSNSEINGVKQFEKIGTIVFDDSVVSRSCDHQLHFHHPVWRDDI